MKPVSGKRMCKIVETAGWRLKKINGSHHVYERPGSPVNLSVPVHRNEDLATGTQRRIMRLAGLTDTDL